MADIPFDRLWQWWRELAKRELGLERQFKPLIDEHAAVHSKRMALENLMAQGRLEVNQQFAAKLDELRKEAPIEYKRYYPIETDVDELNQARSRAYIHLFLKVSYVKNYNLMVFLLEELI